MKWSWRVGQIAGIDLRVHVTLVMLLAWLLTVFVLRGNNLSTALVGMAFISSLFGIVVLHELGHALAARRFGIRTLDITLLPIGGVARLERMPEDPWQELVVALAGPAVNVVLAAMLFFLVEFTDGLEAPDVVLKVGGGVLSQLLWVNVMLAVFNLLPAFPMDGGRVLRAILAMRMDYARATQIAASIGQSMAILFGVIGLFTNPMLLLIAFFVWFGAAQEAGAVQTRVALDGVPVHQAMITELRTLAPQDKLDRAVRHILEGFQIDFPVLDEDRIVGVLTRTDLLKALAEQGPGVPVSSVMQSEFLTAVPSELLPTMLARLKDCDACHSVPVVEHGRLVGLITMDNITEFLMVRQALSQTRERGHPRSGRFGEPGGVSPRTIEN